MIDTHCHLTYPALAGRLDEVLARAREAGVGVMISVGTTPADARQAAALAEREADVYATVGLHPHHVTEASEAETAEAMRVLCAHERIVALGEMGLDYHYDDPPRQAQRRALAAQLETAASLERQLPIVIHNRKATDDVLAMIRDSGLGGERFVFHCFSGDAAEARRILDIGASISFTGIVTFPNAPEVAEAADIVPRDRLMVETDAPYLTPAPYRKVRPNEPRYVRQVMRFLADRWGMGEQELEAVLDANARRFFGV